ncbi:MAG: PEP-CTERM sorting domain-containing protein [Proteobacteria bacterium]|nr:PEP-CTERM sorting domain-containing protein [Pseudomonadota bacterium]
MKKLLIGAALGALLLAGSANAAVTVSAVVADQLNGPYNNGQVLLDDFDGYVDANVAFSGNIVPAFTPPGTIGNSAPPPYTGGALDCCQLGVPYLADDTNYESVQGSQTSTFTATHGNFTSFSFYIGSPDDYNSITFNFAGGGGSQTFNGADLWGNPGLDTIPGDGDRTHGVRVYYDFGGQEVNSITFSSGQDAFEADSFAGTLAVPEPATWALMIMGFGTAGAMLRRRKAVMA